jgi:hypothetical protein
MIRKASSKKTIAFFFIAIIFLQIIAPGAAFALTAGPTAPEATSFEPVDTTDLVNTLTGDFVYSMPLLEVPGPAGGYPLALSYHAGVQPDVEASWVGLGWTLNPGAITRITNGVADDFSGAASYSRTFWEGGETDARTYGVSWGVANVATVSGDLTFANDTYKGRGVGGSFGVGVGFSLGDNAQIGGRVGITVAPWTSEVTPTAGLGISMQKGPLKGNLGVYANGTNVSTGWSASVDLPAGMDVSMSSGQSKPKLGMQGISTQSGSTNDGKISTKSKGFSIDIPVYYNINVHLARRYVRYWTDEKSTFKNYGAAFVPFASSASNINFDSYHLQSAESLATGQHPAKTPEGTFPDYDVYSVNAQGIGGSMRPHHYNLSVLTQKVAAQSGAPEIDNLFTPQMAKGMQFRFTSDFSNRITNEVEPIEMNHNYEALTEEETEDPNYQMWTAELDSLYPTPITVPLFFPYTPTLTTLEDKPTKPEEVASSRHIEYFTNKEIIEATTATDPNNETKLRLIQKGFIENDAAGFVRSEQEDRGKIGAYSITNASGVTYHFSLPAYSFNEYSYTEKIDQADKISFNNLSQTGKYAHTWYLTAVTGPDYVDRGPDGDADGVLNDYDWGYWVKLSYGKWASGYRWRTPGIGFNQDLDTKFNTFSKGQKEVYYLNSIRTKSHTALFVKEIRADGKSTTALYDESVRTQGLDVTWRDAEGGFLPKVKTISYTVGNGQAETVSVPILPTASLRLNSILLFKNEDLPATDLNAVGAEYSKIFEYYTSPSNVLIYLQKPHSGENVLDVHDVAGSTLDQTKVLRKIDLGYDYSLTPATPNSFDPNGTLYCQSCTLDPYYTKLLGKLTLRSITMKGNGGVGLIPPVKFEYDDQHNEYALTISAVDVATKVISVPVVPTLHGLAKGDLVTFDQSGSTFYGLITNDVAPSSTLSITMFTEVPSVGGVTTFRKTKNPPYLKDHKDMWGYFKSNYTSTNKPAIDQYPNNISALNTDVWSLRSVENAIGSKMKVVYESDTYSKNVIGNNFILKLTSTGNIQETTTPWEEYQNGGNTKLFAQGSLPAESSVNLDELYYFGERVDVVCAVGGVNGPVPGTEVIYSASVQEVSSKNIRLRMYVPFQSATYLYAGVLKLKPRPLTAGGGIRVKSIEVVDPMTNESQSTNYTYEFDGKSSGVTSYEPIKLQPLEFYSPSPLLEEDYKAAIYNGFLDILKLSRDIPAPGVMYSKVKLWESVRRGTDVSVNPAYSVFEFEVYDQSKLGIKVISDEEDETDRMYYGNWFIRTKAKHLSIVDFTQRIGLLKSATVYGAGDVKLTETRNHYLHDQLPEANANLPQQTLDNNLEAYPTLLNDYSKQGFVQERFNHSRIVKVNSTQREIQGLVSQRQSFPVIQTGSTTINYKAGITSTKHYLGYDFFSGDLIKSAADDGYGNVYVEESVKAYTQYPDLMGLKSMNPNAKNMLSQDLMTIGYKAQAGSYQPVAMLSASVQTWSDNITVVPPMSEIGLFSGNQPGIPRKKSSYKFIGTIHDVIGGDGLIPVTRTQIDNWVQQIIDAENQDEPVPEGWQRNSTTTSYNIFSKDLEVRDINNTSAANQYSMDQQDLVATAAGASLSEFTVSDAEEELFDNYYTSSGVSTQGVRVAHSELTPAHTGNYSIKAQAGQTAFECGILPETNKPYYASVWSNSATSTITYKIGSSPAVSVTGDIKRKAGNWYLLEIMTPAPGEDMIEVWCSNPGVSAQFDDFRVAPLASSVSAFVYNQFDQLSYILDNNNLFTHFKYDSHGRLIETVKETFQHQVMKVSENVYHNGRSY